MSYLSKDKMCVTLPSMISMQEAVKRYAALKATEAAVGTVQEIAEAAGTTRQLLRYHYNQSLKQKAPASDQARGISSTDHLNATNRGDDAEESTASHVA